MIAVAKLVPVGILEVERGHLSIYLGTSRETADFLADSFSAWWDVGSRLARSLTCCGAHLSRIQRKSDARAMRASAGSFAAPSETT